MAENLTFYLEKKCLVENNIVYNFVLKHLTRYALSQCPSVAKSSQKILKGKKFMYVVNLDKLILFTEIASQLKNKNYTSRLSITF